MTYFDCFVVGAWAFAFGWFFGAIYVQNHKNEPGRSFAQEPEPEVLAEIPNYAVISAAGAD